MLISQPGDVCVVLSDLLTVGLHHAAVSLLIADEGSFISGSTGKGKLNRAVAGM